MRRLFTATTLLALALGACAKKAPQEPTLQDLANALEPSHYWESVWASGSDDVWIVGHRGELRHWDGTSLASVESGTRQDLMGVWGTSATDVWAIGTQGILLHFDGFIWSAAESGTKQPLLGIWGTAPDDVWAVGNKGVILHWDGGRWTLSESGTTENLRAVWTPGANDAWAVGNAGTVLHWEGATWAPVPLATHDDLTSIWGASADDFWVTGVYNLLVHRTGGEWLPILGDNYSYRRAVRLGGTATNDVWVVDPGGPGVEHWDGTDWTWSRMPPQAWYVGMWAVSATDQWFCGAGNLIVHTTGTSSAYMTIPEGNLSFNLPPETAVGVGSGFAGFELDWDGQRWIATTGLPGGASPSVVQFLSPKDGWRVVHRSTPDHETEQLEHFDGASWTVMASLPVSSFAPFFTSIWASGKADVWTAGNDSIAHWDGETWGFSLMPDGLPGPDIVRGFSAKDVWAYGTQYDPGSHYSENINVVLHWDGRQWTAPLVRKGGWIQDFWPRLPTDVQIFWGEGQIERWNGHSWSELWPGSGATLPHLVVQTSTDAWLSNGELLHWDGHKWSKDRSSLLQNINVVWKDRTGALWAAGTGSTILHRLKNQWRLESGTRPAFRALQVIDGQPWVGTSAWGGGGRVLRIGSDGAVEPMVASDSGVGSIWGSSPTNVSVTAWNYGPGKTECCEFFDHAWALWGTGPDDIWTIYFGQSVERNGETQAYLGPAFSLLAIGGTGANNIWVVGEHGVVVHGDGRGWVRFPQVTTNTLTGVWSSGPDDAFVVGAGGIVLHWDGRDLSSIDVGTTADLNAVSGTGPSDVWIAGNTGTVVHWDGTTWKPFSSGVDVPLYAVHAVSPHEVWVAGGDATLLKLEP